MFNDIKTKNISSVQNDVGMETYALIEEFCIVDDIWIIVIMR
jgi:hypothetical protein